MAQLINGQSRAIKNRQSFTHLATINVAALRKLPRSVQCQLERRMSCRLISAGSTIRLGHGKRDDVFFMVMGKAVAVDNAIDNTTITPLKIGDTFSDYATSVGALRPNCVITNTNCVVCSLPSRTYKETMLRHARPAAGAVWSFGDVLSGFRDLVLKTDASPSRARS